ncbi:hypothetical protein FB451DRAFT_1403310 [Mycena latifolia]|nr:hypothetical protein FB451DRAFT_1403310 [Mycena latifolia]
MDDDQLLADAEDAAERYEHVRSMLNPPFKFVKRKAGLPDDGKDTGNIFYARDLEAHRTAIDAVRKWLPDARRLESDLHATVATLELQLRKAKLDMVLAAEIIRENASIVAARKKIPEELLVATFAWIIAGKAGKDRLDQALLLSHVCRAWRTIILRETRFWTTIDMGPRPWGSAVRTSEAEINACLKRSGDRPLDIVLSADADVKAGQLAAVVGEAERWGTLELRSPELICSPHDEAASDPHTFVQGLAQITGRLSALHALTIEGHGRRGRFGRLGGDSLWQGDFPEERDKITWFQYAILLRKIALDSVYWPEETLLLPWNQIEIYREDFTDRPGTMPLAHLRQMSNLRDLRLSGVWLPNADQGILVLPHLTSFKCELSDWGKPALLPNYDRVGVFVLPALKRLDLWGEQFSAQGYGASRIGLSIENCVLRLLERSRKPGLVSLTLGLSTGLTTAGAIKLLTEISTLKVFTVQHRSIRDDGILTGVFLSKYTTVPLSLEILTIQGALGYPEDKTGAVDRRSSWMDELLHCLDFQFSQSLRIVNFRPSKYFSVHCPFHNTQHEQLQELMKRWSLKTLLLHGDVNAPECMFLAGDVSTEGTRSIDESVSL